MRRRLLWVPIAAALIATVLFAVQGGFGGGHSHLDLVIWILGFPGVLMASWAPAPISSHDLLLFVWWPVLWNVLLWAGLVELFSRMRRRRANLHTP